MTALLADTHTALWYLLDQTQLSRSAGASLDQASLAGDPIYLSAISVVEGQYLVDRGKLPVLSLELLNSALRGEAPALVLVPLDLLVAHTVGRVPRSAVPDMPDRIIAATALHLGVPLVTADHKIRASGVQTIW